MSTFVVVNTYTHSVTYVTDKLLTSINDDHPAERPQP